MEPIIEHKEKRANNLSRTKSRIRELVLCNDWSHFVTLTLDDAKACRYDIDGFVKKFGKWVGRYQRKYGVRPKYLFIPEQDKNKAWHMHGLMNKLHPDSLIINKHNCLDMPFYSERFGYISLSRVKNKLKLSSYITKHVSNSIDATEIQLHKHSFYASKGLKRAELIHEDITPSIPIGVWFNDWVGIRTFKTMTDLKMFIFQMYIDTLMKPYYDRLDWYP